MWSDAGRDVRYALRGLLRGACVCRDGHRDARFGHWRQFGDLQRRGRCSSARCACLGSGEPRRRPYVVRQQPLLELVVSGLLRLAGQRHVRVAGGLYTRVDHDGRERPAGTAGRAARERQLLRGPWYRTSIRPRVYVCRRSARGAGSSGGHLGCAMAAEFQRRQSLVGRTLRLNSNPYTVIGIAPAGVRRSAPWRRDRRLGANGTSARSGSAGGGRQASARSRRDFRPAPFERVEDGGPAAAWRQHRSGGVAGGSRLQAVSKPPTRIRTATGGSLLRRSARAAASASRRDRSCGSSPAQCRWCSWLRA